MGRPLAAGAASQVHPSFTGCEVTLKLPDAGEVLVRSVRAPV
jgi:hypothetical protein